MSSDVRRVEQRLVDEGYTLELKTSGQRCAGFIYKALVGDDGDYTRGSQIVIAKQPGARHPVVASEQYVSTQGDKLYLASKPQQLDLEDAVKLAPVPHAGHDSDIVAVYIGADLLMRSTKTTDI